MSLETVLTHLDNARGALVQQLGSKGVSVASSATIYDCASAIGSITTGTDVSSTTAEAGDVLSGKVFYNSGGTMTSGTIPSLASSSYTPTTSDITISAGQYLSGSQTIQGDANLVASNIASGVSIFGVSGTHSGGIDTSDADAAAGDLLSGKTAYVSGAKISGTIPTVSASQTGSQVVVPSGFIASSQTFEVSGGVDVSSTTAEAGDVLSGKVFYNSGGTMTSGTIPTLGSSSYTPGTSNQLISAGQYLGGTQTIQGDANLVASNIASGVSIFGVSGTLPGSTDFYKCASVFQLPGPIPGSDHPIAYDVTNAGNVEVNGHYYENGTNDGEPYYIHDYNGTLYYLFFSSTYEQWIICHDDMTDSTLYLYATAMNADPTDTWDVWEEGVETPAPIVSTHSAPSGISGWWTGYKAILASGIYTFEAYKTHGLYFSSVTPQVGKVYNDGALIEAKLWTGVPDPNLYFTLADATESVTSTALTNTGVTFGTNYAIFDGSSYLEMPGSIYGMFDSLSSLFFCCWFKLTGTADGSYWLWATGDGQTDFGFRLTKGSTNEIGMDIRASDNQWGTDHSLQSSAFTDGAWHFAAFYSKSGGAQFACLDTTYQTNTNQNAFYSGGMTDGTIGKRDTSENLAFVGDAAQLRFIFGEDMDLTAFQNYCASFKALFTQPSA